MPNYWYCSLKYHSLKVFQSTFFNKLNPKLRPKRVHDWLQSTPGNESINPTLLVKRKQKVTSSQSQPTNKRLTFVYSVRSKPSPPKKKNVDLLLCFPGGRLYIYPLEASPTGKKLIFPTTTRLENSAPCWQTSIADVPRRYAAEPHRCLLCFCWLCKKGKTKRNFGGREKKTRRFCWLLLKRGWMIFWVCLGDVFVFELYIVNEFCSKIKA